MKSQEIISTELELKPVTDEYKLNGVEYYTISSDKFFGILRNRPDVLKNAIGNTHVACIGGAFRSPAIAKSLEAKGVSFSTETSHHWNSIPDLAARIKNGSINSDGKIILSGNKKELDTLVVSLDLEYDEEEIMNANIFPALFLLNKKGHQNAKLNIIIVDGDENEVVKMAKSILPDNTEEAPPPFPNVDE